jgi:hypothetical protein
MSKKDNLKRLSESLKTKFKILVFLKRFEKEWNTKNLVQLERKLKLKLARDG